MWCQNTGCHSSGWHRVGPPGHRGCDDVVGSQPPEITSISTRETRESQSHIRETGKLQHIELQGSRWQWIQNILTAMTIFHCNSLDITLILWWCSIWKLNKHQNCQPQNSFQDYYRYKFQIMKHNFFTPRLWTWVESMLRGNGYLLCRIDSDTRHRMHVKGIDGDTIEHLQCRKNWRINYEEPKTQSRRYLWQTRRVVRLPDQV